MYCWEKGVAMSVLGKLTWRISRKHTRKKVGGNYQTQRRPLFLPSKYFISSFHLQTKYRDEKDEWDLPEDVAFDAIHVATMYVSGVD